MQEGGDRGEGRMKKTDCAREREWRGGIERERENGRVMQSVPGLGSSRLFEPRYDPALPPNPVRMLLLLPPPLPLQSHKTMQ